jgi:hypothetical protein
MKQFLYIFAFLGLGFSSFASANSVTPRFVQDDDIWASITDQPKTFTLYQNYPNPFNPSTTLKFELKAAQYVRLKVYNLLGREVANLLEGNQSIGVHEVRFDAGSLPSGAYFYALETPTGRTMRQMLLLK